LQVLTDKYQWLKNTIAYPTLLFGGMGSGKSWTTREIVWYKRQAGWNQIFVLDPHGTEVEWRGVTLICGYEDIARFMQWYMDEMRRRYDAYRQSALTEEQWTQHLKDTNQHFCVIAEEFTTWSDHIVEPCPQNWSHEQDFKPDADFIGKWFRCSMTESRKQLMIPLFVAHDRTMEILGRSKGLSKLRDAALLEVELFATVDPVTTEAKASGKGAIKLPGHQWLPIELPPLTHKRIDFRLEQQSTAVDDDSLLQSETTDPFAGILDDLPTVQISSIAMSILEIIQSGKQPVSFEAIRKSRRWGDNAPAREAIREGLLELVRMEKIAVVNCNHKRPKLQSRQI